MSHLPTRRRFLSIAAVQTAALAAWGAASARAADRIVPRRWRGIALGGEVGIDLFGGDSPSKIFEKCRSEMLRLEQIFSLYRDDSELSQLNRTGQLGEASDELRGVLQVGLNMSVATAGAFDVTVHPLSEMLAAGETDQNRLSAARALVDYRALEIEGRRVRLNRTNMAVTLNGIAQGFITDRITSVLGEAGYTAALVDMGEKRTLGAHPENRPWRVGVRSAATGSSDLAGVFELGANRAIATSGGYGQRYAKAGFHHLLDARSGRSRTGWESVSVMADNAMVADALSTALSVSEPAEAERILGAFNAARPEAKVLTTQGDWLSLG